MHTNEQSKRERDLLARQERRRKERQERYQQQVNQQLVEEKKREIDQLVRSAGVKYQTDFAENQQRYHLSLTEYQQRRSETVTSSSQSQNVSTNSIVRSPSPVSPMPTHADNVPEQINPSSAVPITPTQPATVVQLTIPQPIPSTSFHIPTDQNTVIFMSVSEYKALHNKQKKKKPKRNYTHSQRRRFQELKRQALEEEAKSKLSSVVPTESSSDKSWSENEQ